MDVKIYLCISTIPPRQKQLINVVDSILKNTVLPEQIIINICKTYFRFPEQKFDLTLLEKYKDNKLIKINLLDNDDGPITKVFGYLDELLKLEDLDNKYILTADDDLLYKPTFIESFIKKVKKDNTVIWTGYQEARGKKFQTCFGADGILMKLSILHKIREYAYFLFDKDIRFKYHDDFIFSSYFYLNGIESKRVGVNSRLNEKESKYSGLDDYSLTKDKLGGNNGANSTRDNLLHGIFHTNKDNGDLDKYLI